MKKGETILLLHGWGKQKKAETYYHETSSLFREKGYTVYAPDMPGFGESATPEHPLTLSDHADFIHRFIKKNAICSPILLGHSFGGRVIIKYITEYETDAKAVILSGTPGFTPVRKIKLVASLFLAKIGGLFFLIPGLSKFAESVREWFYYRVGASDYYRAEGSMRQTFKNIVSERLEEYMKKIHIPTLLIWGEEDDIVPVHIAEHMKKTIPNSKLIIIPHGKHSVIVDDPKTFVKEVCLFL